MDLQGWQIRLEDHFLALSKERGIAEPGRPVFALEHGLDPDERSDLKAAIRSSIQKQLPSWEHRLVWTVYSTEIGYLYAGDEYWQTFEEETPGWLSHGNRTWIRKCFLDFHENFQGAKPTGPWAEWFSIICWPIANAILPNDLQRHLAKILYDNKHEITAETLSTPLHIGELIQRKSSHTPTRFQQFAQEPQLIGQIALALLLRGQQATSSLIFPRTLDRIADDLDKIRSAKAWIKGAQDTIRAKIKAVGGREKAPEEKEKAPRRRIGLEPSINLCLAETGRWDAFLYIPSFSGALIRFPNLREALLNSVCYIPTHSDSPKARGWVLFNPPGVKLREWPSSAVPVIRFVPSTSELDFLISAECLVPPGPPWLFKFAADGIAHQLKSARIRPQEKYVILTDRPNPDLSSKDLKRIELSCQGINAYLLQTPEIIPDALRVVLSKLNVSVAGSITIWPVGPAPIRWEEGGEAEYLTTDNPILGIRADHHVAIFRLRLDSQSLEATPNAPGEPVFIELEELEAGDHELTITAHNERGESVAKQESLKIVSRTSEVSLVGHPANAFYVILDPNQPSLEQLWEDSVDIYVYGPPHKHLFTSFSFYERGQAQPLLTKQLGPLTLPLGVSDWRRRFGVLRGDLTIQNAYDDSYRCKIDLRAENFGAFSILAEREFSPIRWVVKRSKQELRIGLRDDSGSDCCPNVWFFGFGQPDRTRKVSSKEFLDYKGLKAKGGLYVAETPNYECSIIIPPEVHSFSDLKISPVVAWRSRKPDKIRDLIIVLDFWNIGRLTGGFSTYSKKVVLKALIDKVLYLMYDRGFKETEKSFNNENDDSVFQDLYLYLPTDEFKIVDQLNRNLAQLALSSPMERRLVLSSLLSSIVDPRIYRDPSHFAWLVAFSLRLASCSKYFKRWARTDFSETLKVLLREPSIIRLSRILTLMIDRHFRKENVVSAQLYAGWEWK
jgi:hypothetical protein